MSLFHASVVQELVRETSRIWESPLYLFFFRESPTLSIICGLPYQRDHVFSPDTFTNMCWPCTQAKSHRYKELTIQLPSSKYLFLVNFCLLLFALQCLQVIAFCFMSKFYSCLLQGSFPGGSYSIITWIRNPSQLPFKFKHLVIWRQNTFLQKLVQLVHTMKSICWEGYFLQPLFIFKTLSKIWPIYLESTSKFHLSAQELYWKLFLW